MGELAGCVMLAYELVRCGCCIAPLCVCKSLAARRVGMVGACLYLKASLPLYSWPYKILSFVMPFLWEFRTREWSVVVLVVLVRVPWVLALMIRRM